MHANRRGLTLMLSCAWLHWACAPAPPPAQPNTEAPPVIQFDDGQSIVASFSVLVDLSGTWHKPRNDAVSNRNRHLLESVGQAIKQTAGAPGMNPSAIRYHIIGDQNSTAPPICETTYHLKSINIGKKDGATQINKSEDLQRFLTRTCPAVILARQSEGATKVTEVLVFAARSHAVHTSKRWMIVLSDLKEEPAATFDISRERLDGLRIVLLYRTSSNSESLEAVDQRVAIWSRRLAQQGAAVIAKPDTIGAVELVSLLKGNAPGR